jgi:hypothetical protein
MRNYWIGLICASLLMLALGCPQQPADQAQTSTRASAANPEPVPTAPDAITSAPASPAEAAIPTSDVPEVAATVTAADVAGTWTALFGRGDQGVNEQACLNGHQLQFNPDGTLLLTLIKDGKPGQQLAGTYQIENDRLEWSYSLIAAVKTGAVDAAPLGMGRDEEIGLLKGEKEGMGRDEEIGLLKGEKEGMGRDTEIGLGKDKEASQATKQDHSEDLRVVLDGPFMALTDDHGQIYIYGKTTAAQSAPLHPGNWQGTFNGKQIIADFTQTGDKVTGALGEYGGRFVGQALDGFIVGKIEGVPKISLAALVLDSNGGLSGVLLTDPYAKLDPQFDFTAAR